MKGRKVKSGWHQVAGEIVKWEPLGAAMCDCLVQRDDGSLVWMASSDLRPTDGLGPLPSRQEAIAAAERETSRSLRLIAQRWEKGR